MALNSTDMAQRIHDDMGFPGSVSSQLVGWASAVIDELTSGSVANASGTITGTCPAAGGSLTSGAGTGGVITGLDGPTLATAIASNAGYPSTTSELTQFSDAIVAHLMTGTASFSSGNVTGTCTNTPSSAGILTNGLGLNGTIVGLSGSALASTIHSAVYSAFAGPSAKLIEFCTAFTDFIMDNAEIDYASGNVTGACPAGGGALSAGTGILGTIS